MRIDATTDLFKRAGPFLSVYVDVSRDTESGEHEVETRWQQLRETARQHGAPEELLDEVGRRVLAPTAAAGKNARLLVADADGVTLSDLVGGSPHAEHATWSSLPDLGAWLVDRDLDLPMLVAVVDHAGADLTTYRPGPHASTEVAHVEGVTRHLHKVRHPRVGGRYDSGGGGGVSGERNRGDVQRSTEEVWRHNARLVAAEIEEKAADLPLVVLAGEPDACATVRDLVGPTIADRMALIERGTRADGGSEEAFDHAVLEAARDAAIAARLRRVHEYEEREGRGSGAADGVRAVLDAMVQGQVETLLVAPDVAATHRVRSGDVPGLTLPSAVDPAEELRADQVLVAAAARTDADVCVTGPQVLPADGAAALLRWDT